MSRFFSDNYVNLTPYTPGEQPQDRQFVKLNTNESPFPPSPMAQIMARQEAGSMQLYSDPDCKRLVAAASDYYQVAKEEIMCGNGSDDILNLIFLAFCDDDTPAIFPDITYGFYPVLASLYNLPNRQIPVLDDFSVRVSDYFNAGGTIFLANPNAPTGITLSKEEVEQILINNPDNVVVLDEAYVDFGNESCVDLIHAYENLIIVQTCSKSRSLAGGRLGFAIAQRELIRDLNTLRYSTNPYNVNRMTIAAGTGAILDVDYFKKCCETIVKTREETVRALTELGFSMTPSGANFLFAKHPGIPGKTLYSTLKDMGILVRHFDKPRLTDYVRITVGSKEQMECLITAIKEILQ